MNPSKSKPDINPALLWEYDLNTFNWRNSHKIVIERIIQRGNLKEWQEMVSFYSRDEIMTTIEWSAELEERDKEFSRLFINSDALIVE